MSGKDDCRYIDLNELPGKSYGQLVSKTIYISHNSKTGLSINSRIADVKVRSGPLLWEVEGSCQPTEWCSKKCYARHGHFATWNRSRFMDLSPQQRKYLLNTLVFHHYASTSEDEVNKAADGVVGGVLERGYDNVRWNGGGDLSPGAVRIINSITRRYPNFRIWGFSRRSDMLMKLVPSPNLYMTVSVDPTTPPLGGLKGDSLFNLVKAAALHGGRMAFATEIRNDAVIPHLDSYIQDLSKGKARLHTIFGAHGGGRHTIVVHDLECPATTGTNDSGCQTCQWCFMTDEQKSAEQVSRPTQAFLLHQAQEG